MNLLSVVSSLPSDRYKRLVGVAWELGSSIS